MGDVALYRRLLGQARPYWLQFLGLFAIEMVATPIALLNPVPLKIVVDSVLGERPLPGRPALVVANGVGPDPVLPELSTLLGRQDQ